MDYSTTAVSAQSVSIACEPGFEYKVIAGKEDVNFRTKCCEFVYLLDGMYLTIHTYMHRGRCKL